MMDASSLRRWLVLPAVVLGLAAALTLGACGDDDDDGCAFEFADVTTEADCEQLQANFDCSDSAFDANDNTCTIGGCLICGDFDTDFDGDLDTDGDIDADA